MASSGSPSELLQDFGRWGSHADKPKVPRGPTLDIESDSGLFRVFVCGAKGSGKTAFITRYINGHFPKWYEDPLEMAHHSVQIVSHHKCLFEFTELDDVIGLVKAREAYPEGVGAVDALVLLYDIGSRSSFTQLAEIYQTILSLRGDSEPMPTAVVANKFDMFQESREVSDTQGQELAESIGAVFGKASAREGDGVKEIVKQIMRYAIDARLREVTAKSLKEDMANREREQEKMVSERARMKRTLSGRILSRLSWGSSGG